MSSAPCVRLPGCSTARPSGRRTAGLGHSVRTGENAFRAVHGVDVWTHRAARPEENEVFNQNMTALTSRVADAVVEAYDFSAASTVVDVGGGQGLLLEKVLERHPHLTGTVFDQPHVVATEPRSPELAPRWRSATGSFFEEVPEADTYVLKSILHDWPDDECARILAHLPRGPCGRAAWSWSSSACSTGPARRWRRRSPTSTCW